MWNVLRQCEVVTKRFIFLGILKQFSFFCRSPFIDFNFQFEPYIQKGNEGFVHHFLLYECEGNFVEKDFDEGVDCDDLPNMAYAKCRDSSLVAAWAVGGQV